MMSIRNTILSNLIFSDIKVINYLNILIFFFPLSIITGPFLPDLILSTVALIGLFLFLTKKINVSFYFEIKILWIFYFIVLLSSLLSNNIIYSLDYTLFYFRFIIFAHFFIYLVITYRHILKLFLFGIIFALFFINLSSFIEILIYFNQNEPLDGVRRLKLPFSDEEIVGSFLIRILPIYLFLSYFNQNLFNNKYYRYLNILLFLSSLMMIFFSGERTALVLLILFFFIISLILIRKNLKFFTFALFGFIFLSSILITFDTKISDRIMQDFNRNTSLDPSINPYVNFSLVSIELFKDKPILGQGPKMFRKLCNEKSFNEFLDNCNMHPHSIYAQLIGETGFLGFIIPFISFIYIVYRNLINFFKNNFDILYTLATTGFILNFFPLIPAGNFFNNWINSLYYISIISLIYYRVYIK